VADVTFADIDIAAVARRHAPVAQTLVQLQKRYPDIIEYEARDSALLVINVSLMGSIFGDNDLAQLKPLYRLDLDRRSFQNRHNRSLSAEHCRDEPSSRTPLDAHQDH
jgi:hypothetical protein